MQSCITCRPTLGSNLRGKLKFTCIICTRTFTVRWIKCKWAPTVFTDASANACTYAQQCADMDGSRNAHLCVFTDVSSSTHLCCASCAYVLPSGREGKSSWRSHWHIPRKSSEPMRQLKLDLCTPSASSNYKSLQLSEASAIRWPSRWILVSSAMSGKLAGLVHIYYMHLDSERGKYGESGAYYNGLFTLTYQHNVMQVARHISLM